MEIILFSSSIKSKYLITIDNSSLLFINGINFIIISSLFMLFVLSKDGRQPKYITSENKNIKYLNIIYN